MRPSYPRFARLRNLCTIARLLVEVSCAVLLCFLVGTSKVTGNNQTRVISIADVKKVHLKMAFTDVYKLLGKPDREICSGVNCAEWKVESNEFLFLWGTDTVQKIELNDMPKSLGD